MNYEDLIVGRTVLLGDVNTHSPYWNLEFRYRQRAESFEKGIDEHGFMVNDDISVATRQKQTSGRSIIDLTLTSIRFAVFASMDD